MPRKPTPGRGQQVERKEGFRISLAELQRMHLRKLQIQLVDDVVSMCETGDRFQEPKDWEEHLEAYSEFLPAMMLLTQPGLY